MNYVIRRGDGEIVWLGGGENIGRPVEILVEPGTTGTTAFTMGAQNLAPGGQVPTHRHPYEEILFVYQGCARITVGGVAHEIGRETAVFIPRDADHSIENIGNKELRLTFTLSPPGYENVFRELARARTDHPPFPRRGPDEPKTKVPRPSTRQPTLHSDRGRNRRKRRRPSGSVP
jgi:quercetin dioxygenase-like cupin family protein